MRLVEGNYEEACKHYEQALAVKPLLTAAWFSLGVATMRLGRWSDSLKAFSRVAQQEPEEGEVRAEDGVASAVALAMIAMVVVVVVCEGFRL